MKPPPLKAKRPSITPQAITAWARSVAKHGRGAGAGGVTGWRRRRRVLLLGAVIVIAVAVVNAAALWYFWPAKESIEVTGPFGRQPAVTFPDGSAPGGDFTANTVINGDGAMVARGDLAVVGFVSYVWRGTSHGRLESSYTGRKPAVMPIGKLIPGLNNGLTGQRVGSRVVMVIPPKDGYGAKGDQQFGVTATDTLVYVVDLLGTHPKTATANGTPRTVDDPDLPAVTPASGTTPAVKIPNSDPPGKLQVRTLINGTGPSIRRDQMLITQYQGMIWKTGKVFDSSWSRGQVAPLSSLSGAIPGFAKGLDGAKVGSRILLVIPPADGWGKKGVPRLGVKSTDTLVYVVDILGAY